MPHAPASWSAAKGGARPRCGADRARLRPRVDVFSDGRRATVTPAGLASEQLARDLLTGLAELVRPHGTVDSEGSIRHYVSALRVMDAALAERGFTGRAADLSRAQVAEFWMGTTGAREACTRRMLLGLAAAGGTLDARVRELAEGRAYNPQPFRRPLPPYPEAVWSRLTEACQSAVTTACREHRDALAGAARGHDPAAGGRSLNDLRWLLARKGPMPRQPAGRSRAVPAPGRHHRLRAAVQRLLRHRPRRRR
jgi:hypothetical protein